MHEDVIAHGRLWREVERDGAGDAEDVDDGQAVFVDLRDACGDG